MYASYCHGVVLSCLDDAASAEQKKQEYHDFKVNSNFSTWRLKIDKQTVKFKTA